MITLFRFCSKRMQHTFKHSTMLTLDHDVMDHDVMPCHTLRYWFTTGVSRMVRKGVVSVQENWRTLPTQDHSTTLGAISRGVVPQILLFRQTLVGKAVRCATTPCTLTDGGFEQFMAIVQTTELAAPFYVVAAGPAAGQGVTLARSNHAVDSVLWLGESGAKYSWALVQTNYDVCAVVDDRGGGANNGGAGAGAGTNRSSAPSPACKPLPDSVLDPRRAAAEGILAAVGREVATTELGAFAVVSTYPVHNPHTAYTAMMSAQDGTLSAFVRTAMCPEIVSNSAHDARYCGGNASAPTHVEL
jgi:hypothetical protein